MKSFRQYISESYITEATLVRKIFNERTKDKAGNVSPHTTYGDIGERGTSLSWGDYRTPQGQQVRNEWKTLRKNALENRNDTDDGAWHYSDFNPHLNTREKSKSKQAGFTFKNNFSIADTHKPEVVKKFGQALPDLHKRLSQLSDHFGQHFGMKVPSEADSVGKLTETIVVHHYDMPDSSLHKSIHATVHKWASDNGIELLNREGTETGVDADHRSGWLQHMPHLNGQGSFTNIMSHYVNTGYDASSHETLGALGKHLVKSAVDQINRSPR